MNPRLISLDLFLNILSSFSRSRNPVSRAFLPEKDLYVCYAVIVIMGDLNVIYTAIQN